jgi:hypothetical protein
MEAVLKITFWTILFLPVGEDALIAVDIGLAIGFFLLVHDMSASWNPCPTDHPVALRADH